MPRLLSLCYRYYIFIKLFKVYVLFDRNSTDVTDVCMDESAVSSDPVIAFLLDEVVVKDWCKRTFGNTITELQGICILQNFETLLQLKPIVVICLFIFRV